MPESTLALSRDDLRALIGHYLGYGRGDGFGESAWTVPQTNNIDDCLRTGLSNFYNPPPVMPGEMPHSWSFLRPFASIAVVAAAATVALPDDFGYFEGPIYITTPTGTAARRWALQLTNEGLIQGRHAAQPTTTGAPRMAALEVLPGTTLTEGTRYVLHLWPVPDQNYTLEAEYKHLPDTPTDLLPFPPGGSEHAETIKASCIAAAELHLDDERGKRWQYFMERLAASVVIDRRKKGMFFGKNLDRSDRTTRYGRMNGQMWRYYDNNPVTYNGNPL